MLGVKDASDVFIINEFASVDEFERYLNKTFIGSS